MHFPIPTRFKTIDRFLVSLRDSLHMPGRMTRARVVVSVDNGHFMLIRCQRRHYFLRNGEGVDFVTPNGSFTPYVGVLMGLYLRMYPSRTWEVKAFRKWLTEHAMEQSKDAELRTLMARAADLGYVLKKP